MKLKKKLVLDLQQKYQIQTEAAYAALLIWFSVQSSG